MQQLTAVREAFTDPEELRSSPLYRGLSAVVAADPYLLGVAAHTREGQVPTFRCRLSDLTRVVPSRGQAPDTLLPSAAAVNVRYWQQRR